MTILTIIIAILIAIIVSANLILVTVIKSVDELLWIAILVLGNEKKR